MQQVQLPFVIQIIQALGPAIVALVVGVFAAFIAYRQSKTANDKLRLDLFDRRYGLYREVLAVLAQTLREGTVTYDEVTEFYRNVRGAEFLFGQEIEAFIEEIRLKLNNLAYHEGRVRAFQNGEYADNDAYHNHVDAAHDLMLEVEPILMRHARSKFEPYLSFSHLK